MLRGGGVFEYRKAKDTGRLQSNRGYLEKWQAEERGKRRIPNVTYLQDGHHPDFQPKKKNENQQEKKKDREREVLH